MLRSSDSTVLKVLAFVESLFEATARHSTAGCRAVSFGQVSLTPTLSMQGVNRTKARSGCKLYIVTGSITAAVLLSYNIALYLDKRYGS
jgi:hypothetical protein